MTRREKGIMTCYHFTHNHNISFLLFALIIVSSAILSTPSIDADISDHMEDETRLSLLMHLKPREGSRARLSQRLVEISTPGSVQYGDTLSEDVVHGIRFDLEAYQIVDAWLSEMATKENIRFERLGRSRFVCIEGDVPSLNRLFHIDIQKRILFDDDSERIFVWSSKTHYSLPLHIHMHVSHIFGIVGGDRLSYSGKKELQKGKIGHSTALRSTDTGMRVDGDTVRRRRLKPGLTTDPAYLREHYNYQGECKSASKIYVLGLSDADKFSPDDFSRFGEKFHHTVSPPIMLANKTINDYSTCEKNPEYCLNLNAVTQYISTGGPGCQIVFSRGSFGLTNLAGHSALETFVHSVAHLLSTSSLQKAVVVVPYVISTILQNANVRDTIANLILDLTANGFTLVVTAGNEGAVGADGNCTSFDASLLASPYTVVVGSTSWSPVSYPSKKSTEVVGMCGNLDQYSVSSTGGGFAEFYDNANLTAWQTKHKEKYFSLVGDHLPVASAYDANGRGFPDISFLGDLYTVVLNEETTFSGGSGPPAAFFGGVLAMIHDLNAEQGGNPIPAWFTPTLYDIYDNNPSAFYDIDVGTNKCGQMLNNGTCPSCVCPNGAAGWRSEKGWDPASGLGSMNVSALFEALNVSMYKGRENYSPLLSTRQLAVVMALILIISTICILVVYGIVVRNDDRAKYEEALLTELSHDEEYESEDDDDARRGHGRVFGSRSSSPSHSEDDENERRSLVGGSR